MNTRADGFNVHGAVRDFELRDSHLENTGDDCVGIWAPRAEDLRIVNVTAANCAVTAGAWSNWGSCLGTYAFQSLNVSGLRCLDPFGKSTAGCNARTHYTAIHLNRAFDTDCMPMNAKLYLKGIEYHAASNTSAPFTRPKCGMCPSCCGSCSEAGLTNLTIVYEDNTVPKGSCNEVKTGPGC
eukprot:UC1_evm1s370